MSVEKRFETILQAAKKMGAADAKLIKSKDVAVRDWVKLKCQYGCDQYGLKLTCPPCTPTPEEFRRILKEYDWALLMKFEANTADDAFMNAHEFIVKLEREAFLGGYYKAFGLASGCCPYCTDCNLDACKHPDLARPSMEAVGIDVFATVRSIGIDLRVVKDLNGKPFYFSLLLVE